MIVEIKLGLQYEPENLDANKVCFANRHEESKFEAVEYFNLLGMRCKCSYLKSLNSSLTCKIAGYDSAIPNLITYTNFRICYKILEAYLGLP